MTCTRIPGGFACSRGRQSRLAPCSGCGGRAVALCDFPLRGAKAGKTCDRPLCRRCATRIAPELVAQLGAEIPEGGFDVCRPHAGEVDAWEAAGRTPPLVLPAAAREVLLLLEAGAIFSDLDQTAKLVAEVRDQLHRDMRSAPEALAVTTARARAALRARRRRPFEQRAAAAMSARVHLAVRAVLLPWVPAGWTNPAVTAEK